MPFYGMEVGKFWKPTLRVKSCDIETTEEIETDFGRNTAKICKIDSKPLKTTQSLKYFQGPDPRGGHQTGIK